MLFLFLILYVFALTVLFMYFFGDGGRYWNNGSEDYN